MNPKISNNLTRPEAVDPIQVTIASMRHLEQALALQMLGFTVNMRGVDSSAVVKVRRKMMAQKLTAEELFSLTGASNPEDLRNPESLFTTAPNPQETRQIDTVLEQLNSIRNSLFEAMGISNNDSRIEVISSLLDELASTLKGVERSVVKAVKEVSLKIESDILGVLSMFEGPAPKAQLVRVKSR